MNKMTGNNLLSAVFLLILVIEYGNASKPPPQDLINKAKNASHFWTLVRTSKLDKKYQNAENLKSRNSASSSPQGIVPADFAYCTVRKGIFVFKQPSDPFQMFWPPAIFLPRCAGYIFGQENGLIHCAPTKTAPANVSLELYNFAGSRKRRDTLEENGHRVVKRSGGQIFIHPVEVHEECDSGCVEDQNSCAARGKLLNTHTCGCECDSAAMTSCQVPFKLSDNCKCVCTLEDSDCNQNTRGVKFANQTTCQCQCNPKSSCLPPRFLRKTDCACIDPNTSARVATIATKSPHGCNLKCSGRKPRLDPLKCRCLAVRRPRPNFG